MLPGAVKVVELDTISAPAVWMQWQLRLLLVAVAGGCC